MIAIVALLGLLMVGLPAFIYQNHVSSILAKLGVRDRTRAVLKALEAGLLGPRPWNPVSSGA